MVVEADATPRGRKAPEEQEAEAEAMAEATCGSPEPEIELNSTQCSRRHINDDGFYFLELSFFSSDFTRGLLWARARGGVGLRGCIERPIHILLHAAANCRAKRALLHNNITHRVRRKRETTCYCRPPPWLSISHAGAEGAVTLRVGVDGDIA